MEGFEVKALGKESVCRLQQYLKDADLLIAIERPSVTSEGLYCTMRGYDISEFTSPIDQILFPKVGARNAPEFAQKSFIGIGDGGNEVGMGQVYEQVAKFVEHGKKIAAFTTCDHLITCDVSNWGAYAICFGIICCLSSQTMTEKLAITQTREEQLHREIAAKGFRDGINKELHCTVDGQPMERSMQIIDQMAGIAKKQQLKQ